VPEDLSFSLPAHFSFTPEFDLLLTCCAPPALSEKRTTARCFQHIDWDAFTTLVDRHQVAALAYAAPCLHAPDRLPAAVMDYLKQRAVRVRARALCHMAELLRLNAAFAEEKLSVISLKGAILSRRLYGDPAMRDVQDIDLLVRPQDLDRADELLKGNGYRRLFLDFPLTRKMKERLLLQEHHLTYCHERLQAVVELHWGFDLWTPGDVAEIWKHRKETDWKGITIAELDDDTTLLSLCSHGAGHKWSDLKWLSDIAVLLAQGHGPITNDLLELAIRLDLDRALAQAAMLVRWLWKFPLDEPLCTLVRSKKNAAGLARVALRIMLTDKRRVVAAERFGGLRYFGYTRRLRRRLPFHILTRKLWISYADFDELRLPDRLFWIYYLLRPFLGLKRVLLRKKKLSSFLFGKTSAGILANPFPCADS
jgi:Uncharacterised nucleotidyltransferase